MMTSKPSPRRRNSLPRRRSPAAFSLVELLVGVSLGLLLLAGVGSMYLFSTKSFVAMSNYSDLNAKSRHASDIISRDIRLASGVTSVTTNQLVLHYPSFDITYQLDSTNRTLVRSQLARDLVLLEGVKSIKFSLYQRPASGAVYEELNSATPATTKLVSFEWSCSRTVYGALRDTQTIEAAIVKLRNK
jgi:hypothetical protein